MSPVMPLPLRNTFMLPLTPRTRTRSAHAPRRRPPALQHCCTIILEATARAYCTIMFT
jgi:hypothetical protein